MAESVHLDDGQYGMIPGSMEAPIHIPPLQPLSLTMFFPCHNEEGNVERVTLAALDVGRRHARDLEVLIVDDGSTDRTGAIADRLAADIPEVRAVHNHPNQGYGGALTRGFREATKEWVFYTDGDGQFDLEEFPRVLEILKDHHIASCYRENRQEGPVRRFNAAGWTLLMNLVFGLGLRDLDGAFKMYPRSFVEAIEIKSRGALVDAEMLAKAKALGLSIGQRGVSHLPRLAGESSGGDLRVILRAFRELISLYRHIKFDRDSWLR